MSARFVITSLILGLLVFPFVAGAAPASIGAGSGTAQVVVVPVIRIIPAVPAPVVPAKVVATTQVASSTAAVPAIPTPGMVQPTTPGEALSTGQDLIVAVKAQHWWFAAAGVILLVMFFLNFFGFFKWVGTNWAWLSVGAMSLAAGLLASFGQSGGFKWATVLGFLTAGPTVGWFRDFVKDGPLKALYDKMSTK